MLPRLFFLTSPQVWERPVALEAELALTLKVLGAMADASQGDILDQPLHTLRHMHSELQACVSAWGTEAVYVGSPLMGPLLSAAGPASRATLLCPQVSAQPTAGPQPQGRLHHWLHRLQEASRKVSDPRRGRMPGPCVREEVGHPSKGNHVLLSQESQGCLEASVLFNLFRLLKKDLECVASGDLCV